MPEIKATKAAAKAAAKAAKVAAKAAAEADMVASIAGCGTSPPLYRQTNMYVWTELKWRFD